MPCSGQSRKNAGSHPPAAASDTKAAEPIRILIIAKTSPAVRGRPDAHPPTTLSDRPVRNFGGIPPEERTSPLWARPVQARKSHLPPLAVCCRLRGTLRFRTLFL